MDNSKIKITILGAGISGLATAYWLSKDGYDITVLESKNEPGGSMESRHEDGFLIDYGPNSGLETNPFIGQIVRELDLNDEFMYASDEGKKRYILRDNQLHALPMNPIAFLTTGLFSSKAKFRVLAEPFIGKSEDGYYQSISEFVKRRLGREFLDYAINPFVAGVFAGNPDHLSVKSAFPKLYRLEEVYGGLFKGLIKGAKERKGIGEESKQSARMFSFKGGMQILPKAIADKLGNSILYNCNVEKVIQAKNGFEVLYTHEQNFVKDFADIVISAIPAYKATSVFVDLDDGLSGHLDRIYYPPVKVLYIGFRKGVIGRTLDGFGFLIPEKEQKTFLGAIWSSTIFPFRANEGCEAFTLFVGGARSPDMVCDENKQHVAHVLEEFKKLMDIDEDPIFIKEKIWPMAIPQYDLGHIEHDRYFESFEIKHPGIFLSGNYRGGISVGDCIQNSQLTYQRIKDHIGTSH